MASEIARSTVAENRAGHLPIGSAERPVVIIPAYKPAIELPAICQKILESDLVQAVIVVDDGSGSEWQSIFVEVEGLSGTTLLRHMINLGKGSALRTAFNYAGCAFPKSVGVVTADADGQHLVPDILAVAEALSEQQKHLVLGARQMAPDVPFRSRFGNTVTRYVMRAITGQKLTDTQTGLRGIPLEIIPSLLKSKATGYDFELDMLVKCKYTSRPIREVPIATVYLEGNRSSHFNPLLDSMRIYFVLLRFTFVSLTTALLDNILFFTALSVSDNLVMCQIVARIGAGMYNYQANKLGVFQSHARHALTLPKYWAFVFLFGALSYALIELLLVYTPLTIVGAKLVAETLMFAFSFVVQRDVIFTQRNGASSK